MKEQEQEEKKKDFNFCFCLFCFENDLVRGGGVRDGGRLLVGGGQLKSQHKQTNKLKEQNKEKKPKFAGLLKRSKEFVNNNKQQELVCQTSRRRERERERECHL